MSGESRGYLTAKFGEPLLIDMLPRLYDNITDALSGEAARPYATAGTNLAFAHGRERAKLTDYAPHELIHELQIFREVLFSITKEKGLPLDKRDAEVIDRSIEEAARESISGFNDAEKEKSLASLPACPMTLEICCMLRMRVRS